jgi:hypothetical protein
MAKIFNLLAPKIGPYHRLNLSSRERGYGPECLARAQYCNGNNTATEYQCNGNITATGIF